MLKITHGGRAELLLPLFDPMTLSPSPWQRQLWVATWQLTLNKPDGTTQTWTQDLPATAATTKEYFTDQFPASYKDEPVVCTRTSSVIDGQTRDVISISVQNTAPIGTYDFCFTYLWQTSDEFGSRAYIVAQQKIFNLRSLFAVVEYTNEENPLSYTLQNTRYLPPHLVVGKAISDSDLEALKAEWKEKTEALNDAIASWENQREKLLVETQSLPIIRDYLFKQTEAMKYYNSLLKDYNEALKTVSAPMALLEAEIARLKAKLYNPDEAEKVPLTSVPLANGAYATTYNLASIDTSACTTMSQMFYGCSSLTSLDVSHFDTSACTNMSQMFYGCSSLTSLDVSHFDTSACTTMLQMFRDCSLLTSLDVSHFDTSACTTMQQMFYGCARISKLDLTGWNAEKVNNVFGIFFTVGSVDGGFTLVGDRTDEEIKAGKIGILNGLCINADFRYPLMDRASVLALLYGLADQTGKATRTLQLGTDLLNKLSSEEKKIATEKNWTLA